MTTPTIQRKKRKVLVDSESRVQYLMCMAENANSSKPSRREVDEYRWELTELILGQIKMLKLINTTPAKLVASAEMERDIRNLMLPKEPETKFTPSLNAAEVS